MYGRTSNFLAKRALSGTPVFKILVRALSETQIRCFSILSNLFLILEELTFSENHTFFNSLFTSVEGGQSCGQHDWVHGFHEPVKSFITYVILSQISCGKVQKKNKKTHIFLHKTVSKFLLGLL